MIFKKVSEGHPYPDHEFTITDWGNLPPSQIELSKLTTTKKSLDLEMLLADDSTFFGDLFAHVVKWNGDYYLEDGLHRAVRSALQQRTSLHARILDLDESDPAQLRAEWHDGSSH
ncbi:MAG: type II toxin-antitoxin system VapB family antitoxin [Candidatus Nanopelagicales bacterium]